MYIIPNSQGTAVAKPRTLEHIYGNFTSAATQNLPSGIMNGDIGLFMYSINGSPIPSNVVPSGWTQIASYALNYWRHTVCYKRLVDSDSGAAVTGQTSGNYPGSVLAVLRPWPGSTTLTLGTVNSESNANDPSQQTVTLSSDTDLAVYLGFAWHGGDGSNTVSGSLATDSTALASSSVYRMVYLPFERLVQSGSRTWDMNDAGDPNCLTSTSIRIT